MTRPQRSSPFLRPMLALSLTLALVARARSEELPAPHGDSAVRQPFEVVRALQSVQDQIAQGSGSAQSKLPKLTTQAGERMLAVDPAVWRDPKNARALIIYALSGGQARVVREIAKLNLSPEPERVLVEGALAYVEGREGQARETLLSVDALSLPPQVGGHVAMVQSMLVGQEDPGKAIAFLDQARVLAPGTLIEETSLRREVLLVEETGDIDKFVSLSSQYFRRYFKSVYAENFRQRFAAFVLRASLMGEQRQLTKFEGALNEIEPADRLQLYLKIARAAIIGGKLEVALLGAEKAMALAGATTTDAARASFYKAAALALSTKETEAGGDVLASLHASSLPKPDADLKDVVIAMANYIRAADGSKVDGIDPSQALRSDGAMRASTRELIHRAQDAMDSSTKLLEKAYQP